MSQTEDSGVRTSDDGSLLVLFDLRIYKISAIKKAAYKFASDCSVLLKQLSVDQLEAHLSFSDNTDACAKKIIARAFCNEVIDQDLREQIAQETEATRNLILAQAFSKTSLLTQE